jgi:hypothetical protein
MKYITLTFSRKGNLIPNEIQGGVAGLRHVEHGFLIPLINIGYLTKRKVIFPPPWLCLLAKHNNNKKIDKISEWNEYYDIGNNYKDDNILAFNNNGSITTYKSVKYLSVENIRNNTINLNNFPEDIIVLTNIQTQKFPVYHELPFDNRLKIVFKSSYLVKNCVRNILFENNLLTNNYTFIHLRRGDMLDNDILIPPKGSRTITNPYCIAYFLKNKISNINIIISTNEKDVEYKKTIRNLVNDKHIFFEEELFRNLPDFNNYIFYQICNELANQSNVNVVTHKLKLGNKIDYKLSDFEGICSNENNIRQLSNLSGIF